MGCSRRGVGRGLALVLLLACFASVNSSEHHDSSFRGDAVGARHGDVASTAGPDAIPAVPVSRPAPDVSGRRTSRAALGKSSTSKAQSDLDVHALRRRAEELEDAMYDEDDAFGLDDPGSASDPLETSETDASSDALLEIEAAAAEAEARAFDEAFPELVRYEDEDEDAAGERSAAFHRRAEEAQTRGAKEEAGGDASYDDDDAAADDDDDASDASVLELSMEVVDEGSSTTKRSKAKSKRKSKSSDSDSTSDSTSTDALIDLLTRKTPPAPKESVAAGGFPSVVVGATSYVNALDTHLDGWQLTWSDEFDGDTLDLTKWTPKSNASAPGLERFGGQQQWYDPSECRVAGGALAIRTRRRPGDDFFLVPGAERTHESEYPFVSCWVDTRKHFSQTYGRVEIRAQFPDHSCPGVWPQHWMLPVPETAVPREACWPVGGEIDIAAAYGKGRGGPGKRPGTVESGYHFAPKGECGVDGLASSTFPSPAGDGTGDGTFPRKMDFHGSFHTFAVEWDKESLKYFVDGTLTNELTRFHVPIIPRWPFYLILNTAVSPFGLPEALQCERDLYHYVDYVRVYQRATKTVDDKVWVFLATAIGGCLAVLFLAACCAMRPRGDEYEEEDAYDTLSPGVIFIDGAGRRPGVRVDSEDGVDRTGFRSSARGAPGPGASERTTVGPNLMHRRRLRPVGNGGPREENLRLFDKPASSTRRRRPREETARAFDSGSEGSLRNSFFAKPSRAAERAPLIGGVALRMPSDANGRV